MGLWFAFLAAVGLERLAELLLSRRNAAWSFAQGGVERGRDHYPFMVVLHSLFLVGCVAEPLLRPRGFSPALGVPMLALTLGAQALRWWCIGTLGRRWNTRVIVVPGLPRVRGGPYRWFAHPNYVAVVIEGFALPLIMGAWTTALAFSVLNAGLLAVRLRSEEAALSELTP